MPGSVVIYRGTAERVQVKVIQNGKYRKWVAQFTLGERRMFFVSSVDVSLFAKKQPDICKDGDHIVVAGTSKSYSLFMPYDRLDSDVFEARAIHDLSTGRFVGDRGNLEVYLGGLLTAVGVGLTLGLCSYLASGGPLRTPANLDLIYSILGAAFLGACLLMKGLPARASWNALQLEGDTSLRRVSESGRAANH